MNKIVGVISVLGTALAVSTLIVVWVSFSH